MTAKFVPIVMANGNLSNRLRQEIEISVMTAEQLVWAKSHYITTGILTLLQRRQAGMITHAEMTELALAGEIMNREAALGVG